MKYLVLVVALFLLVSCSTTTDPVIRYTGIIKYGGKLAIWDLQEIASNTQDIHSISIMFDNHSEFDGIYTYDESLQDMTYNDGFLRNDLFDNMLKDELVTIEVLE